MQHPVARGLGANVGHARQNRLFANEAPGMLREVDQSASRAREAPPRQLEFGQHFEYRQRVLFAGQRSCGRRTGSNPRPSFWVKNLRSRSSRSGAGSAVRPRNMAATPQKVQLESSGIPGPPDTWWYAAPGRCGRYTCRGFPQSLVGAAHRGSGPRGRTADSGYGRSRPRTATTGATAIRTPAQRQPRAKCSSSGSHNVSCTWPRIA